MLRILHIRRDPASPQDRPQYSVADAGRYFGENEGWAPTHGPMGRYELGDLLEKEGVPFSRIERALEEVDRTGSAQVQTSPKVGPRIARAWFDTVCNPLIESLDLEIALIEKRNWTFAFRPAGLELIRPLDRYIDDRARPNLEQILQFDPELKMQAHGHDGFVQALLHAAIQLHESLVNSNEFARICDSLFTQVSIEAAGYGNVREIFGAYPPSDHRNLIAQYIVNSSGELPSHYASARFWNHHRDQLLKVLNLDEISARYDALVAAGTELAEVTGRVRARLEHTREDLSVRYDVPYFAGEPQNTMA